MLLGASCFTFFFGTSLRDLLFPQKNLFMGCPGLARWHISWYSRSESLCVACWNSEDAYRQWQEGWPNFPHILTHRKNLWYHTSWAEIGQLDFVVTIDWGRNVWSIDKKQLTNFSPSSVVPKIFAMSIPSHMEIFRDPHTSPPSLPSSHNHSSLHNPSTIHLPKPTTVNSFCLPGQTWRL